MALFSDADLVKNKVAEYEQKIESDEYISHGVEIVRKRRDTLLAHNDKKYFGKKIGEDTSHLPKYYLWMMRDFVNEILDFISLQLGVSSMHYNTKYDGDLKNLFTTVE